MANGEVTPSNDKVNASVNNSTPATKAPQSCPRGLDSKKHRKSRQPRMLSDSAYRHYIETGDLETMVSVTSPEPLTSPA